MSGISKTKTDVKKIEITVNGKKVTVVKGTFLLQAVREAKAPVPTLCHHKSLTPSGSPKRIRRNCLPI